MENFPAGSGLAHYWLLALPGAEIAAGIRTLREQFADEYGPVENPGEEAVVLAGFEAWESLEETIVRGLQRVLQEKMAFDITSLNFSGFPDHMIYARVRETAAIRELAGSMDAITPLIRRTASPSWKQVPVPHIAIATRLKPEVYKRAVSDYARRDFSVHFPVHELLLLRKPVKGMAKPAAVFRLKPSLSSVI